MKLKDAVKIVEVCQMLDGKKLPATFFRYDKFDQKVWAVTVPTYGTVKLIASNIVTRDLRLNQDYPDLREHLNADDWQASDNYAAFQNEMYFPHL